MADIVLLQTRLMQVPQMEHLAAGEAEHLVVRRSKFLEGQAEMGMLK